MHWNRSDRRVKGPRWLLVGILLLAGALRLVHAGTASLWFDEAFAVFTARLSLEELLATVASDVHPPLYFVSLHFWQKAIGESEFAVRWFSGLCSLLSVWLLWAFVEAVMALEVAPDTVEAAERLIMLTPGGMKQGGNDGGILQ